MKNSKTFYCIICLISVIILIWSLSRNNLVENFEQKNLKDEGKFTETIIKNDNNTYTKKFNNPLGYYAEKLSYLRLNNDNHFPNIINHDDNELSITLEHGGTPIKNVNNIENWEQQLQEISNSLKDNNIQHNDITQKNILVKDNTLKLIDFEWAEDLSNNKEWNNIHRNGNFFCRNIPKINNELNINELFDKKGNCINKN